VPWGQQPSGQHSVFSGQMPLTPQQRETAGLYGNRPAQHFSHVPAAVSPQHCQILVTQKLRPVELWQHLSSLRQQSSPSQLTGRARLHLHAPWRVQICPAPQHCVTLGSMLPTQHWANSSQQTVSRGPMQAFSVDLQQTPRFGSAHFSPDRQHVSPQGIWQHRPRSELTHFSSALQQAPPQSFMHLHDG
jgi:hypothetical protein